MKTKTRKYLRVLAALGASLIVGNTATAQYYPPVAISDEMYYAIGGGSAVHMGTATEVASITLSAGWNANFSCGNFDLGATLQAQFEGITDGLHDMLNGLVAAATGAVAQLPALILQRANPALYNMLTNGMMEARVAFDRSRQTCEAMAEQMADVIGGQSSWDQFAKGVLMSSVTVTTSGDAVGSVEEVEEDHGNAGLPWVGGTNAGGMGQESIKLVADPTRAGYNLLNGRSNPRDESPIPITDCANRFACQAWRSPAEAVEFATQILGEEEKQTCDSCMKTKTRPGMGLAPLIQETTDDRVDKIGALVGGAAFTDASLREAGTDGLPITRGLIEALRGDPDKNALVTRLASETAMMDVLQKTVLLQRTLMSSKKEPNIANNNLALEAIDKHIAELEQQINSYRNELSLRRDVTGNTALAIVRRAEARAAAGGIPSGDPVRDRLNNIQGGYTP
jgi:integrating conjugative element protein (TIGR03755 family)